MKDINDKQTLELKDDEVFEIEQSFDPYDEYGVKREDFAWYGCYTKDNFRID